MSLRVDPVLAPWKATATLAAKQYYAVKLDSSNQIVIATAGSANVGIVQNAPAASEIGYVAEAGHAYAKLGGTVTVQQRLKSDSNGALVAVAADREEYCAIACAGGVSGDVIEVLVVLGQTSQA